MSVKQELLRLRAVAERLPLGDHGDRCLRDLFLEFVDVLTGTKTTTDSLALASSRAPAPPPETLGAVVQGRTSAPAGALFDLPRPAADVADPAGETWLAEQMAADAKAEAEAEAVKAATAATAAAAAKTKNEPKKATPTPNGGH
jgi:hypothetical protein